MAAAASTEDARQPLLSPASTLDVISVHAIEVEKAAAKLESLDYDPIDSVLFVKETYSQVSRFFVMVEVGRWVISLLIGVLTGVVGFGLDMGVRNIQFYKFAFTSQLYERCDGCVWLPLVFLLSLNIVIVSRN